MASERSIEPRGNAQDSARETRFVGSDGVDDGKQPPLPLARKRNCAGQNWPKGAEVRPWRLFWLKDGVDDVFRGLVSGENGDSSTLDRFAVDGARANGKTESTFVAIGPLVPVVSKYARLGPKFSSTSVRGATTTTTYACRFVAERDGGNCDGLHCGV